ncbi:hypothetical protein JXM67_01425 [candidate division WOR-3 bacterium]|nr:hypothetical protein [candidate division WOR-3 bacterium]
MRRWLVVLPILAVLFAGCEVVFNKPASETYTEKFAVADGYNIIDLDNDAGDVTVTAAAVDSISIQYTKSCMGTSERDAEDHLNDIDVFVEGVKSTGKITITADFPMIEATREYKATFNITVPADISLDLVADKGSIDISGMSKTPTLETTNGNIKITGFTCDVDATSTKGDIECTLNKLPASGNVSLSTSDGYQILNIGSMDTTSTINLTATGKGKIEAALPADARLDFDLQLVSGEIYIYDFNFIQGSPWSNKHKIGTIGVEPRSTINATSEDGDVILQAGQ